MAPARKRRKLEPKIRITQHLDLNSDTAQSDYDRQESLDVLLTALRNRRKIVVIAGAGISVSAGIPDFRSAHGLFRSLRGEHKLKVSGKELFDASVYKDDSSTSSFHDMVRRLSNMADQAKPTAFHRLLARLSADGRLLRLYTQNVDGLETCLPPLTTQIPLKHKAPWPQTIQLHGGLEKMMCQKCRHVSDFQAHLFQGPTPPDCPECETQDALRTAHAGKRSHGVGKLRPRMVLYNEHNPDEEAIGAVTAADFRTRPDALVVVGTSVKIPSVRRLIREMCGIVRDRRNGISIWINPDSAPAGKDLEDCWDLIVKGKSDDVAELAHVKEWDDDSPDVVEYNEADLNKLTSSQGEVQVVISQTPQKPAVLHRTVEVLIRTPPSSQHGGSNGRSATANRSKSSLPLKKAQVSEVNPETKLTLKNPASQGRSLSDVLGKENKPKSKSADRPKGSVNKKTLLKASATANTQTQSHIMGKVVKPGLLIPATTKGPPRPLSPRKDSNTIIPMFPNLSQYSSTEVTPAPESPGAEWGNRDTISPRGSIPNGMEKLLH